MSTFAKLPNFSKAAEKLKIIMDLESYIINQDRRTSIGSAILFSIEKKVDFNLLLAELKEHITQGNGDQLKNIIGENLLKRIENYKLN